MVLAESTNLAFILFSQYKPLGLKMQLNFLEIKNLQTIKIWRLNTLCRFAFW